MLPTYMTNVQIGSSVSSVACSQNYTMILTVSPFGDGGAVLSKSSPREEPKVNVLCVVPARLLWQTPPPTEMSVAGEKPAKVVRHTLTLL